MKRLSNNIDKVNRALYELKQVQYDPQDTFYSKIIDTKKSCNELLQDISPIFIYESSIAYRKIEAFQRIIKNELIEDPSNALCIAIQQECQDAIDGFIYTTNKSVANFEQLSQQNS